MRLLTLLLSVATAHDCAWEVTNNVIFVGNNLPMDPKWHVNSIEDCIEACKGLEVHGQKCEYTHFDPFERDGIGKCNFLSAKKAANPAREGHVSAHCRKIELPPPYVQERFEYPIHHEQPPSHLRGSPQQAHGHGAHQGPPHHAHGVTQAPPQHAGHGVPQGPPQGVPQHGHGAPQGSPQGHGGVPQAPPQHGYGAPQGAPPHGAQGPQHGALHPQVPRPPHHGAQYGAPQHGHPQHGHGGAQGPPMPGPPMPPQLGHGGHYDLPRHGVPSHGRPSWQQPQYPYAPQPPQGGYDPHYPSPPGYDPHQGWPAYEPHPSDAHAPPHHGGRWGGRNDGGWRPAETQWAPDNGFHARPGHGPMSQFDPRAVPGGGPTGGWQNGFEPAHGLPQHGGPQHGGHQPPRDPWAPPRHGPPHGGNQPAHGHGSHPPPGSHPPHNGHSPQGAGGAPPVSDPWDDVWSNEGHVHNVGDNSHHGHDH